MAVWAAASIGYFLYILGVAWLLPRLSHERRVQATTVAVAGLGVAFAGVYASAFWSRGLVLPALVLLLAYWSSGLLWTGPMSHVERWLAGWDVRLRVPWIVARVPRPVIGLLEAAYAGIYPLIPLALLLHLRFGSEPDADRFWSVVLLTDLICFGMLPWIQTRPPRSLEAAPPWTSGIRAFNVGLLGRLSIGVNTVPSGHAAEALAAALLLSGAPASIGVPMWFAAVAVSAGAVLGRYHYAVDALAGWLVALMVWSVV